MLIMASIFGGQAVSLSPSWSPWFTFSAIAIAGALVVYGFLASALPVWLLLAPRGYLSTFVKLGVVLLLGLGVLTVPPHAPVAAFDPFCRRNRPHLRGKNFPVLLHHHRLRSRSPDFTRSSRRAPRRSCWRKRDPERSRRGLRLDAAGELCRFNGSHRGSVAPAGNLLRGELSRRNRRLDARRRCGDESPVGDFP